MFMKAKDIAKLSGTWIAILSQKIDLNELLLNQEIVSHLFILISLGILMHGNYTMRAKKTIGNLKSVAKFGSWLMLTMKQRFLIQRWIYKIVRYLDVHSALDFQLAWPSTIISQLFLQFDSLLLYMGSISGRMREMTKGT